MKLPTMLDDPPSMIMLALYCAIAAVILLLSAVNSRGEPASRSTTQRDQPTTVFRDSRGNVTGRASTDSQGTTRFYDARGNSIGTATRK